MTSATTVTPPLKKKNQLRVSVVPFIRSAESDCDPPYPELPFWCVRVVGKEKDVEPIYMSQTVTGDWFEFEDGDVYICCLDTPDKKEANAYAKELREILSKL